MIATKTDKLVVFFCFFLRSFSGVFSTFLSLCFEVSLLRYLVSTASLSLAVVVFISPVFVLLSCSFIRKQVFQNAQKEAPGTKLTTLVMNKLRLFVFERLYMEVMSDLASSKSNFIKVVLIWNSCCCNSFGLFLLFKFMFLAAVLTTDFFFCLTLFQVFFLLLVPVCLSVCLVQSVHMTNDSNSVSQ